MNNVSKDDAFEISDSTDWLETPLRSLAPVESALRCQVCKDFYTTPMITSCSHTFCSLCIRRCLNNDGRCPACRALDQELKLRFNGAVEELVEAFKAARSEVLNYTRQQESEGAGNVSPKRSREQADLEEDGTPKKRTRSSGRRKHPVKDVEVIDSGGDDDDYIPEDGMVLCPICQKSVKPETINSHIDRGCADEPRNSKFRGGASTSFISNSMSEKPIKRPERLPQLHYSTVKDIILRKKLTDLGLSAGGSRAMMEKRYTEWVTLWNANCDATRPKSKGELKRELDIWERTQGARAAQSNAIKDSGSQIRDKDFDGQAWSSKHDDTFKQLIANARKKAVKAQSGSDLPTPKDGEHSAAVPAGDSTSETTYNGDVEMNETTRIIPAIEPLKHDGAHARFLEEDSPQISGPT